MGREACGGGGRRVMPLTRTRGRSPQKVPREETGVGEGGRKDREEGREGGVRWVSVAVVKGS